MVAEGREGVAIALSREHSAQQRYSRLEGSSVPIQYIVREWCRAVLASVNSLLSYGTSGWVRLYRPIPIKHGPNSSVAIFE